MSYEQSIKAETEYTPQRWCANCGSTQGTSTDIVSGTAGVIPYSMPATSLKRLLLPPRGKRASRMFDQRFFNVARIGIVDMADIASNLPSISLSSYRAGLNELVYRGISSGGSWRLESQVAMYLDDIPVTAGTTQLDPRLVDIQRVESLPGPQGTCRPSERYVSLPTSNFDGFSGSITTEIKSTKGGEESATVS